MNESSFPLPESFLKAAGSGLKTPPLQSWNPPCSGAIDIRIAADGTWYHEGRPIRRAALVRLFASILRREDDGRYYLVSPVEKLSIEVDDCPFVAVLLHANGAGVKASLCFELNTGELITAGPKHRLWVEERESGPYPRLAVRDGLDALISRNVFYQLANLALSRQHGNAAALVVWSDGVEFELGALS